MIIFISQSCHGGDRGERGGCMPFRMVEPREIAVADVKVIGVGGGGGNAINTMVDNRVVGVTFVAANTDKQALDKSRAEIMLPLGNDVTKGLGAGADPEKGRTAAIESEDEIRDVLKGSDMVFIAAGLGGGTGTGAAPVVARISKELGALTVAVVTKPFAFEGPRRMKQAEEGWEELKDQVDTIITIPNDRLLGLMEPNSKLREMFSMANNVLLQAVKGISDLINAPGEINADFADLRTVMKEVGPAVMGTGEATGEGRAKEAARKAIDNQLIEDSGIDGARGLLVNISASEETFTMMEYQEAATLIQEKADEDARIIFGVLYDDALGDRMRVTVIATGVGGMLGPPGATIDPRGRIDSVNAPSAAPEPEPLQKGTLASPNPHPGVRLPGSRFSTLDGLGSSSGGQGGGSRWGREEDLDMPTYLRRKAN